LQIKKAARNRNSNNYVYHQGLEMFTFLNHKNSNRSISEVNLRRKISLFIIATFIAGLAIINNGCSSDNSNEYNDGDESINFNIDEPNMKERLGKDDGYAFAVFYGADIHGSLETCG
jgi:hypothetical protein